MRKFRNHVEIWLDEPAGLFFQVSAGLVMGTIIGVLIALS